MRRPVRSPRGLPGHHGAAATRVTPLLTDETGSRSALTHLGSVWFSATASVRRGPRADVVSC